MYIRDKKEKKVSVMSHTHALGNMYTHDTYTTHTRTILVHARITYIRTRTKDESSYIAPPPPPSTV